MQVASFRVTFFGLAIAFFLGILLLFFGSKPVVPSAEKVVDDHHHIVVVKRVPCANRVDVDAQRLAECRPRL